MAILFDLDGTLLDTSHDFHVAINKVLSSQNKPLADYALIRDAISLGSRHIIASAFNLKHLTDKEHAAYVEQLLPSFLKHYVETGFQNTFAFAGIDELLTTLDKHKIKWGIVTNKHKVLTDPLLQHIGYYTRSACIVCGDTTPNPKPAPDPLLHACELLEVTPAECIYIGDAITDIQAGRSAGMRTIAAGFGFVPKNTVISEWQADAIADTPQEILPRIQEWLKIAN